MLGVVAGLDPLVGLFVIERVGILCGFFGSGLLDFVLSDVERAVLLLLLAVLLMKEGTFVAILLFCWYIF